MSEELKPCPFCGSKGSAMFDLVKCYVKCDVCGACGPWTAKHGLEFREPIADAKVAWNRRRVPGESNSPAPANVPAASDTPTENPAYSIWLNELELRIAKLERYVRSEQALKER